MGCKKALKHMSKKRYNVIFFKSGHQYFMFLVFSSNSWILFCNGKKTLTSTSQLLMPCVGKNQPRPPRGGVGEKLGFDSHSNFSPRSTVTVKFVPLPYCVIFSVGVLIHLSNDQHYFSCGDVAVVVGYL